MRTRYSDFYSYYETINSQSQSVIKLKESIKNKIENWSDLELALGRHTKNTESEEDFVEIFEDIGDRLAEYLEKEEKDFDFNKLDKNKLFNYLSIPDNSLPAADRIELNSFRKLFNNTQLNIYITTLNYTQSIEKLLDYSGSKINLGQYNNQPIALQRLEHIHGYINDRMVMGVNDVTQISNKEFHNNQNILESIVKSDCNKAQKHTIDDWCKNVILNANMICIFGSSLGSTDNLWWELIGEQLKREIRLIIFDKGKEISNRRGYKKAIRERKIKDSFLNKTKLTESERKSALGKIIIGINTDMFNLN